MRSVAAISKRGWSAVGLKAQTQNAMPLLTVSDWLEYRLHLFFNFDLRKCALTPQVKRTEKF